MIFNTLNNIIDDIISEIRSRNIAESDTLSRTQIELWIIHYRAVLIKQAIDKGRAINPDYAQTISGMSMIKTQQTINEFSVYKSAIELPEAIDFGQMDGILSINDISNDYKPIQLMPKTRAISNRNRRWTSMEATAYQEFGYLNILADKDSTSFTVDMRIIAENPMHKAFGLSASYDRYPVPANVIPTIKGMIFEKELMYKPVDTVNDSKDQTEQGKSSKK